jgi:hypothetical protein
MVRDLPAVVGRTSAGADSFAGESEILENMTDGFMAFDRESAALSITFEVQRSKFSVQKFSVRSSAFDTAHLDFGCRW